MRLIKIRRLIRNKTFILSCFIIWFIIENVRLSEKLNEISVSYPVNKLPSNFDYILSFLSKSHVNILLIDPFFLNYLFNHSISFEQSEKRLITFGIFNESIQIILSLFSHKDFTIQTTKNLDHIFIEYNQYIIHLAILYKKKSYFLIQKNTIKLSNDIQLSYGDTIRIIDIIEIKFLKSKYLFLYPQNISHYLWLYQTSEYLKCNQILTNKMINKYNLYQNNTQLDLTIKPMRKIISFLNKFEKRYWLAGGTLLGWYRHCGLIPYTKDVDFALFAEEYDENIRNHFLGNSDIYLWGALGLVNDSLEFRLYSGRFSFDLFWTYLENDHRWYGYQVKRRKFKRILPLISKLCSGHLFGYIFSIPCSPIQYLDNEYGVDLWKNPIEIKYKWTNLRYISQWDDISWMYVVRLYTQQGKLRQDKKAIDWIQNHFNYSYKMVPSFRNILPNHPVTLPPWKN